jgi:hypothetical protein
VVDKEFGVRACGPIKFNKEGTALIGRAKECLDRRKKLELEWYGPERDNNPFAR